MIPFEADELKKATKHPRSTLSLALAALARPPPQQKNSRLTCALTTEIPLQQNYGSTYAPSPSPYGNLGPSNISHTSTTMLVPSNSIVGGHVPSIIGTSSALMYPPVSSHMGTYRKFHL